MDTKWKPFSVAEQQYLIANFSVIGGTRCAKNLHRSRQCINQNAKRLGLKLDRSKIMLYVLKKPFNQFNVDPTFFIIPEQMTSVNTYLLGFIWADGHISFRGTAAEISARFVTDDSYDLIPIFKETGKWSIYTQHPYGCREATIVQTNNRPLAEYLRDKGYVAKSSNAATDILNTIPKHLNRHWWRGCFDGDGCFYIGKKYSQISLFSTYEQDWKHFDVLCKEQNIPYTICRTIRRRGKSSSVRISSQDGMCKLIHYLYPNGFEFGLKRKFIKSQLLLSSLAV